MKKLIITFLSVLAMAFTFTGCGDSAGSITSSTPSSNQGSTATVDQENEELVVDNGDTTDTTITNEFGLNPSLGTPPPLPAS